MKYVIIKSLFLLTLTSIILFCTGCSGPDTLPLKNSRDYVEEDTSIKMESSIQPSNDDVDFILNREMFVFKKDFSQLYTVEPIPMNNTTAYRDNWDFAQVLNSENFYNIQWSMYKLDDKVSLITFNGESKTTRDTNIIIEFYVQKGAEIPLAWSMKIETDGKIEDLCLIEKATEQGLDFDSALMSADATICSMLVLLSDGREEQQKDLNKITQSDTGAKKETNTIIKKDYNQNEQTSHIHNYSKATCTEPSICSCGSTKGAPRGHNYDMNERCYACGEESPIKKNAINACSLNLPKLPQIVMYYGESGKAVSTTKITNIDYEFIYEGNGLVSLAIYVSGNKINTEVKALNSSLPIKIYNSKGEKVAETVFVIRGEEFYEEKEYVLFDRAPDSYRLVFEQ